MGDIADMMIDGTLDYQTGEYIGDAVGYPRTIHGGHNRKKKPMSNIRIVYATIFKQMPKMAFKNACDEAIKDYAWNVLQYKTRNLPNICKKIKKDLITFTEWFEDTHWQLVEALSVNKYR